jgi:hypothetical protein
MVAGRSIGLGALCSFGSYGVVFCFYMVVWSPFSLLFGVGGGRVVSVWAVA